VIKPDLCHRLNMARWNVRGSKPAVEKAASRDDEDASDSLGPDPFGGILGLRGWTMGSQAWYTHFYSCPLHLLEGECWN